MPPAVTEAIISKLEMRLPNINPHDRIIEVVVMSRRN